MRVYRLPSVDAGIYSIDYWRGNAFYDEVFVLSVFMARCMNTSSTSSKSSSWSCSSPSSPRSLRLVMATLICATSEDSFSAWSRISSSSFILLTSASIASSNRVFLSSYRLCSSSTLCCSSASTISCLRCFPLFLLLLKLNLSSFLVYNIGYSCDLSVSYFSNIGYCSFLIRSASAASSTSMRFRSSSCLCIYSYSNFNLSVSAAYLSASIFSNSSYSFLTRSISAFVSSSYLNLNSSYLIFSFWILRSSSSLLSLSASA